MRATLTYHSIDDCGSPISVSPSTFETHARWLESGRVRVVPLDQLAGDHPADVDEVAVTFDDGILNVREPIERLLAAGLPVTVFVVTGVVGRTNAWGGRTARGIPTLPLLGWDDLERLRAQGASMASHTRSHTALSTLSGDACAEELVGSLEDLEVRFGERTPHIAYPYGDVNDAIANAAAGRYRWGQTTEFRARRAGDLPLRLPRLDAYYFTEPGTLESWGTAAFARRLNWIGRRRSMRAWLGSR